MNVIRDEEIDNDFDTKIINILKKHYTIPICNQVKKAINYCSIKFHNFLSVKFPILNNNNSHVKILFITYNSSIKSIICYSKTIITKPVKLNSYGVYTFMCSYNEFNVGKTSKHLKF